MLTHVFAIELMCAFALHACIHIAFKETHALASHALISITRLFIGWNDLSPSPIMQTVRVGGPLRWGKTENCVPRVTLGDQWEHGKEGYTGQLMRCETNEICVPRFTLGDQWELRTQGYTGGPMRWGTNGNTVKWVRQGYQWDGRPMRTV